jgi:mRNA interferase MazF
MTMKRGDVFWAKLEPRSGSEQRGQRPVVLISDDLMNQEPRWSSLIVLPITSSPSQGKRRQTFLGPTIVPVAAGEGGLSQESFVLCHQVTTLDRSKLLKHLGTLEESTLEQIAKGLKLSLGLQ